MATRYPEICVIGLQDKLGIDIINGILEEPLQEEVTEHFLKYKWVISNKYYTTETLLCLFRNNCSINSLLFDSSEAVIIYIDSGKNHSLKDLDEISVHFNESVEVKLLVCDGFKSGSPGVSKLQAQAWCIDHGWELVELYAEEGGSNHEDELEDDFADSWGFTRIKQALNAHTWSNLILKEKDRNASIGSLLKQLTLKDGNSQLTSKDATIQSDVSYQDLARDVTECCTDGEEDNFSALFASLGAMKEKALSLPPEERKIYAEKICLAFAREIDTDEDICDSDEDTNII